MGGVGWWGSVWINDSATERRRGWVLLSDGALPYKTYSFFWCLMSTLVFGGYEIF